MDINAPQPHSITHDQPNLHLEAILQAEVWLALWHAEDLHCLDASRINLRIRGNEIWLTGSVKDDCQFKMVEHLVIGIGRLTCCHNSLVIEQP